MAVAGRAWCGDLATTIRRCHGSGGGEIVDFDQQPPAPPPPSPQPDDPTESDGLILRPSDGHVRGDHDLNPGTEPAGALRPAAVLVPLVLRTDGPTVLLTRRTQHLASHAGQISFPGGASEPQDSDAEATALRETEEEVALPRGQVRLLGRLDTYITRSSFVVTPVVGVVEGPMALRPQPEEVAEVFEVPLSFVLDSRYPEQHSRRFMGTMRSYYVFPYGDHYIWGATAGMLVNLRDALVMP